MKAIDRIREMERNLTPRLPDSLKYLAEPFKSLKRVEDEHIFLIRSVNAMKQVAIEIYYQDRYADKKEIEKFESMVDAAFEEKMEDGKCLS